VRLPRVPGRLPNLASSAVHFARVKLALESSLGARAGRVADPAAEARRAIAEAFAARIEPARTAPERAIRDQAIAAARAAARGQPKTAIENDLDLLLRAYTRQP
jgi:hypothetical protein